MFVVSELGHPEDVLGDVLVAVFEDRCPCGLVLGEVVRVGYSARRLVKPGATPLERVGDVLQEEKAEEEVLVLGGLDRPA